MTDTAMVFNWHGLSYDVRAVEPGDQEYSWRPLKQSGDIVLDQPPSFILKGRVARYALLIQGLHEGEPIMHAYNMRPDENYWATPFGQHGFTFRDGCLGTTHKFRRSPRLRRRWRYA
jgi:hypothetical protein